MDYEKELLREMSKSLERLDASVDAINITLAKQETHLEEHIKRTAILENEMKPIHAHVTRVNALMLMLGGLLAVLGAIKTVIEILHLF